MSTLTKEAIVLDPDVYDAMEFATLASGGIGEGWVFLDDLFSDGKCPVCAWGHAEFAGIVPKADIGAFAARVGESYEYYYGNTRPAPAEERKAWRRFPIAGEASDEAVVNINERKGDDRHNRVTFAEWCAELNVVRGEA